MGDLIFPVLIFPLLLALYVTAGLLFAGSFYERKDFPKANACLLSGLLALAGLIAVMAIPQFRDGPVECPGVEESTTVTN